MTRVRLLPIVLFALTSLLFLKAVDLIGRSGLEIGGPAPAYAGGAAEMPAGEAPATPVAATEGEAPAPAKAVQTVEPLMPLGSGSPAERAILERLQQRREQLEQQGRELDMRENLLKAAEKRIGDRIGELKQLEASVGTAQQAKDDAESGRMKSLVVMYEAMKPKDAARIFDRLEMTILVAVASAMKPAKVADVMAAMDAEAAQRLTVALANRVIVRAPAPDAPPALDLPKIEGQPPRG